MLKFRNTVDVPYQCVIIIYCMATQLANRSLHLDFRSAKSRPPYFLKFTLGCEKGLLWGSSIYRVRGLNPVQSFFFFLVLNRTRRPNPVQLRRKPFFFWSLIDSGNNPFQIADWAQRVFVSCIWTFAKTS